MFQAEINAPAGTVDAVYCLFHGADLITDASSTELCLLPGDQIRFLAPESLRQVFLGYWHGKPCFARELDPATPLGAANFRTGNLYQILGRVPDELFALAGRAQQLLAWDRENSFCGSCGESMNNHQQERARVCEPCGSMVYPRIAPCVIVLINRASEMLLARNANFPGKMFSTLSGFIEAGETVEECLLREVKEEVGLDVDNIRYFKSQSWPFPNQLMLGFFAEYKGGEIVCEDEEIAEAYWFTADQLPTIPPIHSISGQLIQHHIENYSQ